ncbi:RICIN domain-containing protein [Actinoallomurus sp. NPDC052274]|uniref:RICIN domain-containing protein n=1 Tax=Actinoallomurus sp. NPDC052274 TaxID=3155420 RepID=UPI00341A70DA
MSEQNETERQRQERAKLVSAFNKRAWQPSEQPQLAPRVLAGGAALIVVAGTVFGIGALSSYSHKKAAEEHARQVALSTGQNPAAQNRTVGETAQTVAPQGGTPQQTAAPQQGGGTRPGRQTAHNALPQAAGPVKKDPKNAAASPPASAPTATAPGTTTAAANAAPSDDRAARRLQLLAAQQGGETAPYIAPRPAKSSAPSPTSASPKAVHSRRSTPRTAPGNAAALPNNAGSSAASGVLLKNVMTGMCVDVPGFGKGTIDGKVQQHTCDGSSADNQRWDLVVGQKGAGPNGADLFTIRNTKDGYCLDLPDYGTVDKGDVTEWYCDPGPGDNQMWYLERKSSGAYWIRNVKTPGDQCLDVAGLNGSGGQDAKLTTFPCSLQDDHLWTFVR